MNAAECFFDTSVLLYLLSGDARKADLAEDALAAGGTISVQVLNEFAAVALRKLGMSIDEVREILATIRTVCKVVPITEAIHDQGLALAARYGFALYDAMIVAAALDAGCTVLWSEDMQSGQLIENRLKFENPFGGQRPGA
jgi:predicted nucleic acid-binding protein